ATELIEEAATELDHAHNELRELARGMYPAVLADGGLGPAVQSLAERAAVPVRTSVNVDRHAAVIEATAYFVVSEALVNVAKHAHARSVTVTVQECAGSVRVEVSDDGVGGADASTGSGINGLQERVTAVGGSLQVDSVPGHGTVVVAVLPCG